MKKIIPFFLGLIFTLVSCSSDSENIGNSNSSIKNSKSFARLSNEVHPQSILGECPSGQHKVYLIKHHSNNFKKFSGGCTSGFGLCFRNYTTITTICVDNPPIQSPNDPTLQLRTAYNASTDEISGFFEPRNSTTMRFYIKAAAQTSPSHIPSDFNNFDITSVELSPNIILNAGSYPKVVYGNYFYYDIPYAYIP